MHFEPVEFAVPHPSLDISIFLIVEDAIRVAWEILRNQPPVGLDLASDNEETINHHLRETLQDQIWDRGIVPGFDAQLVRCITSAEEVRNYAGKELKKRPDMLVKLVGLPVAARPSQHGIFIECKPVDPKHSLVSQYCKRGISRFVVGRYAWAMQEAMMVAYVASTEEPLPALKAAFQRTAKTTLAVAPPERCLVSAASYVAATTVTQHKRAFNYVENGMAAPAITLRHLWLRRN